MKKLLVTYIKGLVEAWKERRKFKAEEKRIKKYPMKTVYKSFYENNRKYTRDPKIDELLLEIIYSDKVTISILGQTTLTFKMNDAKGEKMNFLEVSVNHDGSINHLRYHLSHLKSKRIFVSERTLRLICMRIDEFKKKAEEAECLKESNEILESLAELKMDEVGL